MLLIPDSVGDKGENIKSDVLNIQAALNKIRPALMPVPLVVDGIYGKKTGDVISRIIKQFNRDLYDLVTRYYHLMGC